MLNILENYDSNYEKSIEKASKLMDLNCKKALLLEVRSTVDELLQVPKSLKILAKLTPIILITLFVSGMY